MIGNKRMEEGKEVDVRKEEGGRWGGSWEGGARKKKDEEEEIEVEIGGLKSRGNEKRKGKRKY